jgi:DNA mismatch endonuclease, patch repair protein
MVDVVSPVVRSKMMSGIQGKNTKAEVLLRKALYKKGFRYRLYVKSFPGKPDLVFPKYKAVIQINGCFWHGHNCYLFRWPSSHCEFWYKKIINNKERDSKNLIDLAQLGWRVLTIWECAIKGKYKIPFQNLIEQICIWLTTFQNTNEITNRKDE